MGTVSFEFELDQKQMRAYGRFRQKFFKVVSADLVNINKDLIDIIYLIQTKLQPAVPADTTSVKLPAILSSPTGESLVTSAGSLVASLLHEFEKVTHPPAGGAPPNHYGDRHKEADVRLHILGYSDRVSFEAARWNNATIRPSPIYTGDEPFAASILNHLDSLLQGIGRKASAPGKTQLANWRANTADPGNDVARIRLYTQEVAALLIAGF
jgi:hypothetical protein